MLDYVDLLVSMLHSFGQITDYLFKIINLFLDSKEVPELFSLSIFDFQLRVCLLDDFDEQFG